MALEALKNLIRQIVHEELDPLKEQVEKLIKDFETIQRNLEGFKKDTKESIDRILKRVYALSEDLSKVKETIGEKPAEEESKVAEIPIFKFSDFIKKQEKAEEKKAEEIITSLSFQKPAQTQPSKGEQVSIFPQFPPKREEGVKIENEVIEDVAISSPVETKVSSPKPVSPQPKTAPQKETKISESEKKLVQIIKKPSAKKPSPKPSSKKPSDEYMKMSTKELYDLFVKLSEERESLENDVSMLRLAMIASDLSEKEKRELEEKEKRIAELDEKIGEIARILTLKGSGE